MYVCMYNCLFHISGGEDGTPLACAASKGHVKVINYLLGQNVDVNGGIKVCNLKLIAINISEFCIKLIQTTPLILASKNGHEKSVKQLLQQPHIDVTIQDENGHNCLALAALNRYLYV